MCLLWSTNSFYVTEYGILETRTILQSVDNAMYPCSVETVNNSRQTKLQADIHLLERICVSSDPAVLMQVSKANWESLREVQSKENIIWTM
jgi:hypothetical protein